MFLIICQEGPRYKMTWWVTARQIHKFSSYHKLFLKMQSPKWKEMTAHRNSKFIKCMLQPFQMILKVFKHDQTCAGP